MAPTKFGLFKGRSRDNAEQPPTETAQARETNVPVKAPDSPIPSTSKGVMGNDDFFAADIFLGLTLDDDDDELDNEADDIRSASLTSQVEEPQVGYENLQNPSTGTSEITLDDGGSTYELQESTMAYNDDASTSCDSNSIQYDTSVTDSKTESLFCSMMYKTKKTRSKDQQLSDIAMWEASNNEVTENLLARNCSLDEQIKWEAIATARGLCTLNDTCTCADCTGVTYLAGITDGDGGIGVAPLLSAINFGCIVQ